MKIITPARMVLRKLSQVDGRKRTIVTGVVLDEWCPDGEDRLLMGAVCLLPLAILRSNGGTHGKTIDELHDFLTVGSIGTIWVP